jgi:hypothetical protein
MHLGPSTIFAVFVVLPCSGCFSTTSGPADAGPPPADALVRSCPAPADTSDADLTAPTVSLLHNVVPIFEKSCGIAGANCHGDPGVTTQARPFLGYFNGGTDPAQVAHAIVGVPSQEDPAMELVTPGNLARSFLWQKVDDTQCEQARDCADRGYPDCGAPMPYDNPALDDSALDTIARWIAQGAKTN